LARSQDHGVVTLGHGFHTLIETISAEISDDRIGVEDDQQHTYQAVLEEKANEAGEAGHGVNGVTALGA
jgi:hypothetical protein